MQALEQRIEEKNILLFVLVEFLITQETYLS
jgi:hypothetical protein